MFIIVNNTNMVDIMILTENKFLLFSYPERNFPNTTLRGFFSESARYSIHLKKSITWSACGNGRKKKKKKKRESDNDNDVEEISKIWNLVHLIV